MERTNPLRKLPYHLGLELAGGQWQPLLSKGTPLPVETSYLFTTVSPHQYAAELHILKAGDGPPAVPGAEHSLLRLLLPGIPPLARPSLQVRLAADVYGLVELRLHEPTAGSQPLRLLPELTLGELRAGGLDAAGSLKRKQRVGRLITYLRLVAESFFPDEALQRELQLVLRQAGEALLLGTAAALLASQLCLESMINTLYAQEPLREVV